MKTFTNIDKLMSYLDHNVNATPTATFLNAVKTQDFFHNKEIFSMEQFEEHLKEVPANKILEYLESTADGGAFYGGDDFVFVNSHGNLVSDSSLEHIMWETGVWELLKTFQRPDGSVNIEDMQEKFGIPDDFLEEIFN